jgi:hypothetical protein
VSGVEVCSGVECPGVGVSGRAAVLCNTSVRTTNTCQHKTLCGRGIYNVQCWPANIVQTVTQLDNTIPCHHMYT